MNHELDKSGRELHDRVLQVLLRELEKPTCSAAMLRVAARFLADNGVTAEAMNLEDRRKAAQAPDFKLPFPTKP